MHFLLKYRSVLKFFPKLNQSRLSQALPVFWLHLLGPLETS